MIDKEAVGGNLAIWLNKRAALTLAVFNDFLGLARDVWNLAALCQCLTKQQE